MNTRNLILIMLLTCSLQAGAQEATEKIKPTFHAVGSVGLLEGDKSSSFQLQLLNGFVYKGWYAGVGTGLDYYFIRSIPLTGYLEKQISPRFPVFVYGGAGVHFIWRRDLAEEGWYDSDYNHGLYYDAGFGYQFSLAKNAAIRLSLGFSEKQVEETRTWASWDIWGRQTTQQKEIYAYKLKRLSLRAGFRF